MLLRRALVRELARGKWSLLAALIGLSVAVASVAAVHLLNARVERNMERLQPYIASAHVARRDDGSDISIADYARLGSARARGELPLVQAIVPLIEGKLDGGWRILGMDWVALRSAGRDPAFTGAESPIDISKLLTTRSVLIPESLDSQVLPERLKDSLTVLGTHPGSDERLLVSDIATASELLRQRDVSALALYVTPEASPMLDLLDRLFVGVGAVRTSRVDQDILGAGFVISTPDEEFPVRRFVSAIMFNLGVLSVLCLLVAGFIAYQSATGTAARRAPLLSRLRAMGADGEQMSRFVYTESAVFGFIACLIGLPLGIAASSLAVRMGGMEAEQQLMLDHWLLIKVVLVGLGVSLLGTALAQPREEVRPVRPWRTSVSMLAACTAMVVGYFYGLPGAFLTLGGLFLLVVHIAWLKMRWISHSPLTDLKVRGRQVLRAAGFHAQRLFAVVSAFILALAVALAMQLMVSNLKKDFDAFLDQRLEGDLIISSASSDIGEDEIRLLESLPGVKSVRPVETANARVGPLRARVRLIEYSPAQLSRYDAPQDTPTHAVLVNGQLARQLDGTSHVEIIGSLARTEAPVAHEFNDLGASAPRIVMSRALGRAIFADLQIESLRLEVDSDAASEIRSVIEQDLGFSVQSSAELKESANQALRDTFWVSDALTVVALLVAVFGMITGFNQLHLTRLKEFRLLRGVGMSSRQLLALVAAQSGTLALLAIPFSLSLALIMSWVLCQHVNPLAFGFSISMGVDWGLLLLFTCIGLLVAPLASLLPWRMTREASDVATSDEYF